MSITKDDMIDWTFNTDGEQINCEPMIKTSKVADELVSVWEKITIGKTYANKSQIDEALEDLNNLIKTLRANEK